MPPQNPVDRRIGDVSALGVKLAYPDASLAVRPARDRRDGELLPLATDEDLDHRLGVPEMVRVIMDSLATAIRFPQPERSVTT